MAQSHTLQSGFPRDTQASQAQAAPSHDGKVAKGGTSMPAGPPAGARELNEVVSFMSRLSAFEKRSSQVKLLVR